MKTTTLILAGLLASAMAGEAIAADNLKLAVGQRGNWDTAVAELGQRAGIFAKHDLELDLLYTQGGGETMQAVISGSVDIGVAAGTLGVLGAFSKGAPVRIIGAEATGAADFWYVPADSKLQSLKDADADTTIAYSTNGSSTNSMVLGFINEYGLKSQPVATGSPAATFTPVMTGQVDVGWSSPPFGFDALDEGKIRIIARGNDIEAIRNQSIRTLIANQQFMAERPDELQRFMAAYRETIDWMYSGDEALQTYAEFADTDVPTAKRIRDEFFPQSLIDPDEMSGMPALMEDAVKHKVLTEKLSDAQLAELIQIPARQ
ncbi:possible periplasmic substrate-binding protein, ABC-type transporter [Aurantimonas manganoxydans SI85-9A1]|uniref:Possible periplasmic substrate-binding protein, ABC-type transporter n=1 Tax=Aurantimonas manganoxydans (strain ATCC BAA-1229 / DSM 21871 / SI85-9A1) TaxID=287752 RepID=Q1YKX4_AURMS|nr:ABC transporter substrate-binding protein [Aurantimonas manganoxydans]EAS50399.1 possible periplasmic substrate-binding protein, ABC-type transporter [Aurantimonas manganoxydans SI85-9A1]